MIENKTLSLFKHNQPIYQNDLINWLDKNTKVTCKEIVIKGKVSINQEAHPFFKEFLDLILDYRPDCKIILYTNHKKDIEFSSFFLLLLKSLEYFDHIFVDQKHFQ